MSEEKPYYHDHDFYVTEGGGDALAVRPLQRAGGRQGIPEVVEHITLLTEEIGRLQRALQVCEYALHLAEPEDEETHAAQQASGAWRNGEWEPEDVYHDLPAFLYAEPDQEDQ